MSEVWTPKTQQAETWTSESEGRGVFSPFVFSHDRYNGKRVFAFSSPGFEGWYRQSSDTETWTPQ